MLRALLTAALAVGLVGACEFTGSKPASPPADARPDSPDVAIDAAFDQPIAMLIDRGLAARYYIDESDSLVQDSLVDSSPSALDATVTRDPAVLGTCNAGPLRRGLCWNVIEADARADADIAGSNIETVFTNGTRGTIEVVVSAISASPSGSRFFQLGPNDDSQSGFALMAHELGRPAVTFGTDPSPYKVAGGTGILGLDVVGARRVIHAVVDSSLNAEADRFKIYINGVREPTILAENCGPGGTCGFPALSESLGDVTGWRIALGNRQDGSRSFEGGLFYAALYSEALTAGEIAANTALLLSSDDTPRN